MSFTEELTQLVTIIVALLLVLFGVNFWTKKGGSIKLPSMGNKASGNVEGGINNESVESVDGMGVGQDEGTSAATSGGSAADRNAERFGQRRSVVLLTLSSGLEQEFRSGLSIARRVMVLECNRMKLGQIP